jgi:hypothetical protein
MASSRNFDPHAPQYERLMVALADLRAQGRAAVAAARAAHSRSAALRAEQLAIEPGRTR